ncbi:MAG: hypothetical protein M1833_005490 [Piccolia ochrophora]|nr:MAG: hypothetical protein M1833_005490 [Piccolia ochrophora]
MKGWTVQGKSGFDSLQFNEEAPVPTCGDSEVLVRFHAASLNYRDLIIPKGMYPFAQRDGVVPGSDGAGTVEDIGSKVHRFQKGDRVATLFNQGHLAGSLTPKISETGVGGVVDGTITQYGVFSEEGLVEVPSSLNWLQASTLSCAALTAWNALYGLKKLMPGETVLTQGTGGVSIFAAQFALAAGARVIATTSSDSKAQTLKDLGVQHVINYKTDPNWGETAKSLTPDKLGVQHIIEVGGANTMAQSLKAIAIDGIISIIGFLGGRSKEQPGFTDCLSHICTVRGVLVGSRLQFAEMNRAIEANNIKPVIDKTVFRLEQLEEAYQYMWDQKHFGKLCINIE